MAGSFNAGLSATRSVLWSLEKSIRLRLGSTVPLARVRLGRYQTLAPIASGGMAKVWLAKAHGTAGFERLVAIKLMHEHLAGDSEFVGMFIDEARIAARIRHPNVVGTIDAQKADEGLFIVMEYIEGPSLSAVLTRLQGKRHSASVRDRAAHLPRRAERARCRARAGG